MNQYQSNIIQKGCRYSIVEADEYDRSFLQLYPDFACVTAMDVDHLDIYGDHANMKKAFVKFSKRVSQKMVIAQGVDLNGISYAVEGKASYCAKNISTSEQGYQFDLVAPSQIYDNIYFCLLYTSPSPRD